MKKQKKRFKFRRYIEDDDFVIKVIAIVGLVLAILSLVYQDKLINIYFKLHVIN